MRTCLCTTDTQRKSSLPGPFPTDQASQSKTSEDQHRPARPSARQRARRAPDVVLSPHTPHAHRTPRSTSLDLACHRASLVRSAGGHQATAREAALASERSPKASPRVSATPHTPPRRQLNNSIAIAAIASATPAVARPSRHHCHHCHHHHHHRHHWHCHRCTVTIIGRKSGPVIAVLNAAAAVAAAAVAIAAVPPRVRSERRAVLRTAAQPAQATGLWLPTRSARLRSCRKGLINLSKMLRVHPHEHARPRVWLARWRGLSRVPSRPSVSRSGSASRGSAAPRAALPSVRSASAPCARPARPPRRERDREHGCEEPSARRGPTGRTRTHDGRRSTLAHTAGLNGIRHRRASAAHTVVRSPPRPQSLHDVCRAMPHSTRARHLEPRLRTGVDERPELLSFSIDVPWRGSPQSVQTSE